MTDSRDHPGDAQGLAAARLARMGRVEFLLAPHRLGVSALNLSAEDLADDFAHA